MTKSSSCPSLTGGRTKELAQSPSVPALDRAVSVRWPSMAGTLKLVSSGLPGLRVISAAFALIFAGFTSGTSPGLALAQRVPERFLIVKYGDESATPEIAGDFLRQLAIFLEKSLHGTQWTGRIANTPEIASRLLRDEQPSLLFIPPGFYLEHCSEPALEAEILVEVPRFGSPTEHYYIVVPKAAGKTADWLRGKTVESTFSVDLVYLKRVVFPANMQPGKDFQLRPAENLSDQIFLLLERSREPAGTPAGILLDEELRQFFEQDDLVWPELQVMWSSVELPRDIIVGLSPLSESQKTQLRRAFLNMDASTEGREILELMNSSGMKPLNRELFEKARARYESRK